MGLNRMADSLSAAASAYSRDDDPEFVRVGAPATLKMVEMLLERQPAHQGLLITACSGFTQYAHAFLEVESEIVGASDAQSGAELRARAARMYARARGYCLRSLGVTHGRLADGLVRDPRNALSLLDRTARSDVPALYWTGASWAGELGLSQDQLVRLSELAVARAVLERALALDEGWQDGALHETMIALEGLPAVLGGSAARARKHFERATTLSRGQSAFSYVTLAAGVSLPAGNRSEFERLLKDALAIDAAQTPERRLANLIAQKHARFLLSNADRLFK
jgi:predicted anti-sigma-YlaC factor YlaD